MSEENQMEENKMEEDYGNYEQEEQEEQEYEVGKGIIEFPNTFQNNIIESEASSKMSQVPTPLNELTHHFHMSPVTIRSPFSSRSPVRTPIATPVGSAVGSAVGSHGANTPRSINTPLGNTPRGNTPQIISASPSNTPRSHNGSRTSRSILSNLAAGNFGTPFSISSIARIRTPQRSRANSISEEEYVVRSHEELRDELVANLVASGFISEYDQPPAKRYQASKVIPQ